MYIDQCQTGPYTRILVREKYRENGKVKRRTLANMSDWRPENIESFRRFLQATHQSDGLIVLPSDLSTHEGVTIGPYHLLLEIANTIGLNEALGLDMDGRLAMWQVLNRLVNQGSRLSAVRQARDIDMETLFSLGFFTEDTLYTNLDWLKQRQESIENALFRKLHPQGDCDLFFYDVTSSYLEGHQNELAAYGYNRDGKKGKMQIVVGLLCDCNGIPISISVFPGNTNDTKTFAQQIRTVAERFHGKSVTFVGDRGMIKSPQIEALMQEGFQFITALTRKQIETLIQDDTIEPSLFDENVTEVIDRDAGLRYVIRRNPSRAEQIARNRAEKINLIKDRILRENERLVEKPRAYPDKSLVRLTAKIIQLKLDAFFSLHLQNRTLVLTCDEEALREHATLDGCYVLKTNVLNQLTKDVVHQRYKALAEVERAFKVSKTDHLEMRPIYLRLEDRTRAHALVVMLAYRIRLELAKYWSSVDLTPQECLNHMKGFKFIEVKSKGNLLFRQLPEPNETTRELYRLAGVELPRFRFSSGEGKRDSKKTKNKSKSSQPKKSQGTRSNAKNTRLSKSAKTKNPEPPPKPATKRKLYERRKQR